MCVYTHIFQQHRDTSRANEIKKNTGTAVNAACHRFGSLAVPYQFLRTPFKLTAVSGKHYCPVPITVPLRMTYILYNRAAQNKALKESIRGPQSPE